MNALACVLLNVEEITCFPTMFYFKLLMQQSPKEQP